MTKTIKSNKKSPANTGMADNSHRRKELTLKEKKVLVLHMFESIAAKPELAKLPPWVMAIEIFPSMTKKQSCKGTIFSQMRDFDLNQMCELTKSICDTLKSAQEDRDGWMKKVKLVDPTKDQMPARITMPKKPAQKSKTIIKKPKSKLQRSAKKNQIQSNVCAKFGSDILGSRPDHATGDEQGQGCLEDDWQKIPTLGNRVVEGTRHEIRKQVAQIIYDDYGDAEDVDFDTIEPDTILKRMIKNLSEEYELWRNFTDDMLSRAHPFLEGSRAAIKDYLAPNNREKLRKAVMYVGFLKNPPIDSPPNGKELMSCYSSPQISKKRPIVKQLHTEPKSCRRLEFDGLMVPDGTISEGDFLMQAGSKLDEIQERLDYYHREIEKLSDEKRSLIDSIGARFSLKRDQAH